MSEGHKRKISTVPVNDMSPLKHGRESFDILGDCRKKSDTEGSRNVAWMHSVFKAGAVMWSSRLGASDEGGSKAISLIYKVSRKGSIIFL